MIPLLGDAVRGQVGRIFGGDRFPEERYDEPLGDAGLFGPDSVTWTVHADVSMVVGGIAALLLQALHPDAATVVAGSSRFREEPLHRLSRTASFVAATTYGATPVAEAVIERVRATHARIPGASESHLLTWVHAAEVAMFLRAHRRYHPWPVRGRALDRYLDETAVVAERLGADNVPRSRAELRDFFRSVGPDLSGEGVAADLVSFIRRPIQADPATRTLHLLFIEAAVDLLSPWARSLHGLGKPPVAVRPATWWALQGLRVAAGPSPLLAAARARVN